MSDGEVIENPTEAEIIEFLLDSARLGGPDDVTDIEGLLKERPELVDAKDEFGITMMHRAAANNHKAVVDVLVQYGAKPNVQNAEGNTALHWAAVNNRPEMCQRLIELGWDVSTRNSFGQTAMNEIEDKDFEDVEVILLQADKELDAFMEKCQANAAADGDNSSSDDDE